MGRLARASILPRLNPGDNCSNVFIDSHAHIDFHEFDADRDEMLNRARVAGVDCIVNPGSDLDSCHRARALAERHANVFYALGLHPHYAKDVGPAQWEEFVRLVRDSDPVAIGETGLDYHYDFSPRDVQLDLFRKEVRLTLELDLPIIIHCREAHDDCLKVLREEAPGRSWRGVMHCFTGSADDALAVLDLGFLLAFAGMLTFPNAAGLRQAAATVPPGRLLLETDSPYLAPHPMRGNRNEPAFVLHTARVLAELQKLTVDDIARITSANARRLFGIGEDGGKRTIVYKIRNSLYVNLTNRCSNRCVFCSRETDPTVKGHWLRLEQEPSADEVIGAIGDPTRYSEVVFCGFGEPTLRLDVIKQVAAFVKSSGGTVRINTNGHAGLIHGRPVAAELAGLVDTVSVSLNSADRGQYVEICRPQQGQQAYDAMIEFIKDARKHLPAVIVTALDYPGVDLEACKRLAAELGVEYRQRKYQEVG